MSDKIISKPPTPEYEESWERVFGKKKEFLDPNKDINVKFTLSDTGHIDIKEVYQS